MPARHLHVLLLLFGASGCAAIFGSKQKDFSLSSAPQGAEVYLNGNRLGTTPVQVKLSNQANHTFVFRREGYCEATCTLSRGTDAGWVILDILAGLVPVVIDAATNSWSQTKGDGCQQALEPIAGAAGNAPAPSPAPVPREAQRAPAPAPSASPGLVDDLPPGTNWVANSKTKTYYRAGCPVTASIPPSERLYYGSDTPLQSAGFTKSDQC